MMRTILSSALALTALALAALAVSACGGGDDEDAGDDATEAAVTVVAATPHLADLAAGVAGERAEVIGLLAANVDPHDYEPRPSDALALAEADLILQSGGDLDLWLDGLIESSGTDAPVVVVIESVETITGGHHHDEEDEHGHDDEQENDSERDAHADDDEIDPHWWQSPANAMLAVEEIRDHLIEIDPEGLSVYETRAAELVDRIETLDLAIAACVETIPEQRRKLVTTHDSLGYFADRYDFEVVGATIPALTTRAQPSAGETAELVDLIRDEGVPAVFPEAGIDPRLEQAIADEAGATVGGELWADSFGPEGSGAETYVDAMLANTRTIGEALGGDPRSCAIGSG